MNKIKINEVLNEDLVKEYLSKYVEELNKDVKTLYSFEEEENAEVYYRKSGIIKNINPDVDGFALYRYSMTQNGIKINDYYIIE